VREAVSKFMNMRVEGGLMRKSKKEIHDKSIITDLLNACGVGRLGTNGGDGFPMVKPLNYVYHDGNIYFHSAKEGEKIDDIKRDNRVCFEIDLPIALVRSRAEPCRADYFYRSVIIKGRAFLVEGEGERMTALKALLHKYQPEGGYSDFLESKLAITAVIRIEIEEISGKQDLGRDKLREQTEKALAENVSLPIVLSRE
jgi:nitroimidazol reductase NimA-like FMN-containing flavoprotein (pyridoxamine 5'-phosphate oxidase superfamily)